MCVSMSGSACVSMLWCTCRGLESCGNSSENSGILVSFKNKTEILSECIFL